MTATAAAATAAPSFVHLLVITHGLWGNTSHVKYLADSAKAHVKATADGRTRLVVLSAGSHEWVRTYDGIDVNAERVVEEIDREVERIRAEGDEVTRFSIVGYSLGGLVARYTLGLLDSRTPSFFQDIKPVNFATFASPAIGIPTYKSFWSPIIEFLGSRLLSRSGAQLYGADRFLPSSFLGASTPSPAAKTLLSRLSFDKEPAEPLLSVLADPRYSFFKALLAFERVDIYANSVNDRTVPYPTGAIEAHDPFALAKAKALAGMKERGEDLESPVDYAEGGLDIIVDPENKPLIASFKTCAPRYVAQATARPKRRRFVLPLLLRPTTYPFSRPVSLLIIVTLPIALPISLMYIFAQFLLQSTYSRRRIKLARSELGGGKKGWLERVGVKLQEAVDAVDGAIDSHSESESLSSGNSHKLALDGQPTSPTEEDELLPRGHPVFAPFASYRDGIDTPPLLRPLQAGTTVSDQPFSSDPVLSDRQLVMIKNLNSIPQLKKHLTFLPHARNSHGVIVCRDTGRFAGHADGKPFVDAWAKDFVL